MKVFLLILTILLAIVKCDEISDVISKANQLISKNKNQEAAELYQKFLKNNPNVCDIHIEYAYLLAENGFFEEAIQHFSACIGDRSIDQAQLYYNIGYTYQQMKNTVKSYEYYSKCIEANKDFVECHVKIAYACNIMQNMQCQYEHLKIAIQLNPKNPSYYIYLGDLLNNLKHFTEAISTYEKGIEVVKHYPKNRKTIDLYSLLEKSIGDSYSNIYNHKEAIKHYNMSYNINGDGGSLIGLWKSKDELMYWNNREIIIHKIKKLVQNELNEPTSVLSLIPYFTLFLPFNNSLKYEIAHRYFMNYYTYHKLKNDKIEYDDEIRLKPKITVGYISRRFEKYPGTQLMLQLFGNHNRNRFKIISYAHGPDDNSYERNTVRENSDIFYDISLNKTEDIVKLIKEDNEIDILMDYDGVHDFNNLDILINKPSPIIISFLGFAGTSGSSNSIIDYIITDRICTEVTEANYFSEKLFVMPNTYQPQDEKYPISSTIQYTKEALGLKSDTFVFMCFNRNNKIDPLITQAWIQILKKCPNSIIYLYFNNGTSKDYFINYFQSYGLTEDRIRWGVKLNKSDHLARQVIGDLSLDTLYYGMHTTASDSMYVNIPVLTVKGNTFSNRVGSSLIRSANMPFLITNSIKEYINTAILLYEHPKAIDLIKKHLKMNRGKYPLFDSVRYTKNLERGYEMIYDALFINRTKRFNMFPIDI